MEFRLDILQLLVVFGAFQGIILAFILLTTPRLKKLSNTLLAVLLLSFASLNLQNTVQRCPTDYCPDWLVWLPFFSLTLIPISLYLFLYYLLEPVQKFEKRHYILFVPFLIEVLFNFYRLYIGITTGLLDGHWLHTIQNVIELAACLATIWIIIDGARKLKHYEIELLNNFAEIDDKNLAWLRHTFIGGLVLTSFWVLTAILDFFSNHVFMSLVYLVWIGLSILILWIGYSMIIRQGLLESSLFAVTEKEERANGNSELSAKTDDHYQRLLHLMDDNKLYTNPNLNMTLLAEQLELSNGYVSQILNHKEGKNFFEFINEYRVQQVKTKMADPAFDHYTILAIAQDAGFKSKSTFNSVFKRMTGKTPSEFKKKLQI
jgi:AraC-like DNA-binding protein